MQLESRVVEAAAAARQRLGSYSTGPVALDAWRAFVPTAREAGNAEQKAAVDLVEIGLARAGATDPARARMIGHAISWLATSAPLTDHLGGIASTVFSALPRADQTSDLARQLLDRLAQTGSRTHAFLARLVDSGAEPMAVMSYAHDPRLQNDVRSFASVGGVLGTASHGNVPIPDAARVLRVVVDEVGQKARECGDAGALGRLERLERYRALGIPAAAEMRLDRATLQQIASTVPPGPADALQLVARSLGTPSSPENPVLARAAFDEAARAHVAPEWTGLYDALAAQQPAPPPALLDASVRYAADGRAPAVATVIGAVRSMLGSSHSTTHVGELSQALRSLEALSKIELPVWRSLAFVAGLSLSAVVPAGQPLDRPLKDEARVRNALSYAFDDMGEVPLEDPQRYSEGLVSIYRRLSMYASEKQGLARSVVHALKEHEQTLPSSPLLTHVELIDGMLECGLEDRNIVLGIVNREVEGLRVFASPQEALLHGRTVLRALRTPADVDAAGAMLQGKWKQLADGGMLDGRQRVMVDTLARVAERTGKHDKTFWDAAETGLWMPCEQHQAAEPADVARMGLLLMDKMQLEQLREPLRDGLKRMAAEYGDEALVPPLAERLATADEAECKEALGALSRLRGEGYRSALALNNGPAHGQVQDDGDTVVVGGIRVPKRHHDGA
jgi:hypothetical protein